MSVFICDKDRLVVFGKFLAGFYGSLNLRNGSILKPFNKLAVYRLSPRVFIPDKTLLLIH